MSYSKDELKKKIEEFGGKVVPALTIDVDYMILLPKGQDLDNKSYQDAVNLGITIMSLEDLLDFIGR